MKKYTMIMIAVAAFIFAACNSKPAANQEKAETTETAATASVTPEKIKALVDAEWDSVPQAVLDDLGFKALKLFKQEVKDAQCDNLQYYFGKGASVELDNEGQLTKSAADDDNAIIVHITAESVAYGSIAFRNEADYNDFVKKIEGIKPNEEGEGMEFEAIGKDPEMNGYEKDKWFFVNFTNDK